MLQVNAFVALALWASSYVTAQECEFKYSGLVINSTQEAHDLFAGCTTIISGSFHLSENFTGTFSLPGVTNITGMIGGGSDTGEVAIEMPDLQYVGGFSTLSTNMSRASFPELRTIGESWLHLDGNNKNIEISFPKLTTASRIYMSTRFSKLDFSSLETISSRLEVEPCAGCRNPSPSIPDQVLELLFPALKRAGFIKLVGRFSALDFPSLTKVGPPDDFNDYPYGSGITIDNVGGGLELAFPKLAEVDGVNGEIDLSGAFTSLELPLLLDCEASLVLNPSTPLSFELPMVNSGIIELHGNIQYASIPDLGESDRTNNVRVFNHELPCSALGPGFQDTSFYKDSCVPHTEPSFGTNEKIIVGVIVPVVVIMVAVGGFIWYRTKGKNGGKNVNEAETEIELSGVNSGRPGADTSGAGGTEERGRAPVTRSVALERERSQTPPPPYAPKQQ
ncbi:hypothetical protein BJX70DRAFT_79204 [Aspergillus crustosus]